MYFKLLPALACALASGAAQAQVAPTRFEIRLWEQEGNVVAPLERRLYSTRFDANRSRSIGAEVTLGHAPAKVSALYPMECELLAPEGGRSSKRNLEVQVFTGADESRAITLWSRDQDFSWAPGHYLIRCSGRGIALGEVAFDVAVNPPDASEIDLRVTQIRMFPASGALPAKEQRAYTTRFIARRTSRIGVDLDFVHAPPGNAPSIPIDCYYYPPRGQPMGPISFNYEPQAEATDGNSGVAMGWDSPGKWSQGNYTAVCSIRGRPVAVERFVID